MQVAVSTDMVASTAGKHMPSHAKVSDITLESRVRLLHCLFGVLHNQQKDELCRNCKSFAATLEAARKSLIEAETCMIDCSCGESARVLFLSVYTMLGEITEPDTPIPQRKTRACSLPDGICMLAATARLAGCA